MKSSILISCFILLTCLSQGQKRLSYHFQNTLEESMGAGAPLSILGDMGMYVLDTLNELSGKTATVYRFARNNGVQFNNSSHFIKNSYSIEIYFVFDELSSWKRVIDWKNRTTDFGAYIYNGELNFYPYVYSGSAPVVPNEYTYYVLTHDSATNVVKLYTDAIDEIEFTDAAGDALTDTANVLNFFYDDLIVQNEASAGAVALLNLYNYVLDSAAIKNNFDSLQGKVFSVNEIKNQDQGFMVYPDPATDHFTIRMANASRNGQCRISLLNTAGMKVFTQDLPMGSDHEYTVSTMGLPRGLYLVMIANSSGIHSQRIMIR